jgi:hypothetical protein
MSVGHCRYKCTEAVCRHRIAADVAAHLGNQSVHVAWWRCMQSTAVLHQVGAASYEASVMRVRCTVETAQLQDLCFCMLYTQKQLLWHMLLGFPPVLSSGCWQHLLLLVWTYLGTVLSHVCGQYEAQCNVCMTTAACWIQAGCAFAETVAAAMQQRRVTISCRHNI